MMKEGGESETLFEFIVGSPSPDDIDIIKNEWTRIECGITGASEKNKHWADFQPVLSDDNQKRLRGQGFTVTEDYKRQRLCYCDQYESCSSCNEKGMKILLTKVRWPKNRRKFKICYKYDCNGSFVEGSVVPEDWIKCGVRSCPNMRCGKHHNKTESCGNHMLIDGRYESAL